VKILRLRLCNLSSLRDTTAIDFTLPPLANSGLFAITGPTGAGKSTLLDAITLALYGRVARYGSIPSPDAVMSRHTGECSAEIEFSCAAGTFRSVWQLQRARKKPDGKLQAAKRRVIVLPAETVIAESIKDADAKILELTGLDYERFLRSVLLAQGDFAAFLKAGPKERTDLLQQVTGTAIYQEISKAAFRRAADAEQTHANLLRDHQAVPVLDTTQRDGHESSLTANVTRLAEVSVHLQTLAKRLTHVQRWTEIEQATRILDVDTQQHADACRAAAPIVARLARHEKAAPFIADLTSLHRLAVELEKNRKALAELEPTLPELAHLAQTAEANAQTAQAALAVATNRHAELHLLWTEVTELDKDLATRRETLRQASGHHTQLESHATSLQTSLVNLEITLKATADGHANTVAWLAEHRRDATLAAQLPDIQGAHVRWSASESAATAADQALTKLSRETEALDATVHVLQEKRPPVQRELGAREEIIAALSRQLEAISEQLPVADLESQRDRARDERLAIEQLAANALRLRTVAAELIHGEKDAEQIMHDLALSGTTRTTLQQQHEGLAKLLAAHRISQSLAEKVQSLEAHRADLREETPCPLCGSTHHPYANAGGLPTNGLATIRRMVVATEKDVGEAQQRLTEAEKRHASLLTEQKRVSQERAKLGDEYAALKTAWNTSASPHGLTDRFQDELALRESLRATQTKENQRKDQVVSVRAVHEKLEQARAFRLAAKAELERIEAEIAKQTALAAQSRRQLPDLARAAVEHRETARREKAAMGQCVSTFASWPIELAAVPGLLTALKVRAAALAQKESESQTVLAEHRAQAARIEAVTQQIAVSTVSLFESQGKVTAAAATLALHEQKRREKFGDRLVAVEQQVADAMLKRTRDAAESAHRTFESSRQTQATALRERDRLTAEASLRSAERELIANRLTIHLSAAGFENETDLRGSLLSTEEAGAYTAQTKTLEAQRITLTTQAAALAAQRQTLPLGVVEDAREYPALQADQARGEAERAALHGSLGAIRAILKSDDEQRVRLASFAVHLEKAHQEYVRWNKLRALIGSADGSSFARFAQGLTLAKLSHLANRHLTQLNPRYSIRRASDGEAGDLELEIIDHYQADVARPMRSLSGGESFLVSLALALGLSELASGRTTIESVFIDEGFGSLDADTLETAMSALESLQARGKTIGIISHVPAMQERIPAQIRVTKESGGWSRVTLVA